MKAFPVFAAVFTVGAFAILFAFVLVAPRGDRSLLDLSPQASAAYQDRLELEHAEEMARIEARRETRDRVLILFGVVFVVAIVCAAFVFGVREYAAARRPDITIAPPSLDYTEWQQLEYWQQQEQHLPRGYIEVKR